MSGKKGYEEPNRDRGTRDAPGRERESSESSGPDRDFGGQRKHEDPLKKDEGERSQREPRS